MKKLHLLKTMLLLCALIVGSSSVWAEEETITLSEQGYSNAEQVSSTVGTNITLTYTDGGTATAYYDTGNGVRIYAGGSVTVTAGGATITAVSITHSKEKTPTISWGTSGTSTSVGTPATWSGSATSVTLNVTNKGHIRMQSVTVTYTPAAKEDPAITFSNGSVRVGKTLDLSTLFTSNSSGAVTYSITSGDTYASVSENILTGNAAGSVIVQASQAAAGKYNAKTATATITVNPALVLSSIAVTAVPTKTTYTEGETFDPAGMVVTATYADNSTDDVTTACTFTPSGALTTSDDKITISYTENEVTKTTTYDIIVNPHIQPTTVTIQMTNSLFGEAVHTSGKSTKDLTFSGTQDGVTVTYYVPNDSYYYFNTSNTRPYDTCTLDYAAPTGYVITKIVFTSDGSNWNTATPSVGEMTATKQWEGVAGNVTFSWETSGTRIKTVVVSLAESATISLNAACNDGKGNIYGTYSNSKSFVVPADLTVSAVNVEGGTLTVTNYETGNIVKANTGVMVSSTEAGDYTILLSDETGEEIDGNMLKASSVAMTGDNLFYRLTMHNGEQIGFWWGEEEGAAFSIAANKAYLAVPSGEALARGLWFDEGETTAISEVRGPKAEVRGEYFNLNGQRVAQPTKGLYIVNGRKVVIK